MKSSATHIRPIFDRPTLAEKLADMVGRNWEQPSVDEQADLNAEPADGIDWDAYDAGIVEQSLEAGLDRWEEVDYRPTNRKRWFQSPKRLDYLNERVGYRRDGMYRSCGGTCQKHSNHRDTVRKGRRGARKHRTLHDRRAMPNAWRS